MVSRSRDVQEQEIRFNLTDRPIILDHRPMDGNRRQATGEQAERKG
jgi:hypothetical protein